ncbi:hypothetical protein ABZS96_43310 [Streptomyces avermitilis]|uniref:hypothetical protein n=1 Tax=Streptomyces avermitilis TaxID=33903 RepID=UPI0033BE93D8
MLPARIRSMLPQDPIDVATAQTDAATTAVTARQTELQELLDVVACVGRMRLWAVERGRP